jgi:polyribonucleotide nucleotidyltransferase
VKISRKFHGSIIGKGGANLKRIRDDTSTKIDMPKGSEGSDTIVITGRRENVDKAKRQLLEIEKQMASIVEVVIKIPHQQHNAIIGPKGKLIRSVMDECGGVKIHFPTNGSNSDEIHINGPKEDVSKAKAMLLELANQHAIENYTTELKCKPEYHRFLIGKGGAKIRRVREQLGARVVFPQKDSGDDTDTVTIIGTKDKVEATKEHLMKLIKELDDIVEVEISVDVKFHRHFVQRRGQLIHEISEENGNVIIVFPRSGSTNDKVIIKGAKQCVEGAKLAINEIVEDLEAQVTIDCVIPRKNHRDVLGPKGTNVQVITQEHNVTIKFPDREPPQDSSKVVLNGDTLDDHEKPPDPRDIITISGRSDNCENAKKALLDLVPVTIHVPVPLEYHRYIVGTRGQDVRHLADKHNISIEVPRPELNHDKITLFGPPANCEEAKEELERRLLELEAEREERELRNYTEVIHIDSKHHPNIIGRKGATINKIREDYGVRIQLPEKDHSHSDDIKIIGYEHQVHAAMDAILKIVHELVSISYH